MFILDVANQIFIVRGVETADHVNVWVAFHGHPQDGRTYCAEIEFNFQEDEVIPHPRNLAGALNVPMPADIIVSRS